MEEILDCCQQAREYKKHEINEDGTITYTLVSKKNGKEYKVTYDRDGHSIVKSKFDIYLPQSDSKQFKHLTKELTKAIERNPELAKNFTEED